MFKEGVKTNEGELQAAKKYKGLGLFKVTAVNPTMDELSEMFPTRIFDREPDYDSLRNKETPGKRICFQLQTPFKEETIDVAVSYFLYDCPAKNKDDSKIQVVNCYGQSRWITIEEAKSKVLPDLPSNQMPFIGNWRPAYYGEADLLRFIRAYLGTPGPCIYVNATKGWKAKDGNALKDAEGYFEGKEIKAILAGDMKPLKDAIAMMPENKVKMLMGVRRNQSGSLYQDVYRFPLSGNTDNPAALVRDLENAKKNSQSIQGTDYGVAPFPIIEVVESYTSFQPATATTAAAAAPMGDDNFFGTPAATAPATPPSPVDENKLPDNDPVDDLPF
jgi:hypothetical protein